LSKLLLVRHGETELNSAERFWGHTDVELSATGVRQAERLRDRLATQNIDVIYTSNLSRALATAKIIASLHQADIVPCAELQEINFGKLEGLTFKEISRLYPEIVQSWYDRSLTFKFPGGESGKELDNRVTKFLSKLEKRSPDETMLIVAHSGVLRMLVCHLWSIEPSHWWHMHLDLASLSILDTYPQGAILSLLNDTSHLTGD